MIYTSASQTGCLGLLGGREIFEYIMYYTLIIFQSVYEKISFLNGQLFNNNEIVTITSKKFISF